MVGGRRHMIEREFRRASHVDAIRITAKRRNADAANPGVGRAHRAFSLVRRSGSSARHTLSRSFACADATGWTPSGWNIA